jgi:Flp pilus assembly protein TadB
MGLGPRVGSSRGPAAVALMTPAVCALGLVVAVLLWPRRRASRLHDAGPGPAVAQESQASMLDLADTLTLLALAMRSGTGALEALESVARVAKPVVREQLRAVAAAGHWGVDPSRIWDYAPGSWEPARTAWSIATAAGAPPAGLLEQAAERIRDVEVRRLESAAARTGSLLVLPLGCAFLPAFACTTVVPIVVVLASSLLGS